MRVLLKTIQPLALLLALLLALQASASMPGGESAWHEHDSSYHQVSEAVRLGQALPLHRVRAMLPQVMSGRVVATDYEFEFDRWVYEFKVIDADGRLRAVHLDAKTGDLVEITDY